MDNLTRKILENAKKRRAERLNSQIMENNENTNNASGYVSPLIKKFESRNISEIDPQTPIYIGNHKIPSIKERIESIHRHVRPQVVDPETWNYIQPSSNLPLISSNLHMSMNVEIDKKCGKTDEILIETTCDAMSLALSDQIISPKREITTSAIKRKASNVEMMDDNDSARLEKINPNTIESLSTSRISTVSVFSRSNISDFDISSVVSSCSSVSENISIFDEISKIENVLNKQNVSNIEEIPKLESNQNIEKVSKVDEIPKTINVANTEKECYPIETTADVAEVDKKKNDAIVVEKNDARKHTVGEDVVKIAAVKDFEKRVAKCVIESPTKPTSPCSNQVRYPSTPNTPKILLINMGSLTPTTQQIGAATNSKLENLSKRLVFEMSRSSDPINEISNSTDTNLYRPSTTSCLSTKTINSSNSNISAEPCLVHNKEKLTTLFVDLKKHITQNNIIIHQTSQALDVAYKKGKTRANVTNESIEAERLLLLSTHKRKYYTMREQKLLEREYSCNCAQNSIGFYRVDVALKDFILTVSNDYLLAGSKDHSIYYFCCIIACKNSIFCTNAVKVTDVDKNKLHFKSSFKINGVSADEYVKVELYGFSSSLAPSGSISALKKLRMSVIDNGSRSSKYKSKVTSYDVANFNEVGMSCRTPEFVLVGHAEFSVNENPSRLSLKLTDLMSEFPVTGDLEFALESHHPNECFAKGFLTCSNFQNNVMWKRLWCGLLRDSLSMWEYPDEERTKTPLYVIELKWVTHDGGNVKAVPYSECARPNSFEVHIVVDDCSNSGCKVDKKYLFCADSKEERNRWMQLLEVHRQNFIGNNKHQRSATSS